MEKSETAMVSKRKHWVDVVRGICMTAILYDHTDIYYSDTNVLPYELYVPNALTTFFILSGYLMYKRSGFCLKNKIRSIMKGLLLPYLIFTIAMALPKSLAHGLSFNIADMLINVLSGKASWFVAALFIAEMLFSIAIRLTKGRTLALLAVGTIGLIASTLMPYAGEPPFPWQADNALQAMFYLSIGYAYHKHEEAIEGSINRPPLAIGLLSVLFVGIKAWEMYYDVSMTEWYINIDCYPMFLLDTVCGAALLILICKRLPRMRLMEWTGIRSLGFYFLCGGVPLTVSMALQRLGLAYNGCYLTVLLVFLIVYILTAILVWALYKYVPFVFGKWRIKS